jgi:hypothetical protein
MRVYMCICMFCSCSGAVMGMCARMCVCVYELVSVYVCVGEVAAGAASGCDCSW